MQFADLNPFRNIKESKASPHAQVLRTTLLQKLSIAKTVIFGEKNRTDVANGRGWVNKHVGVSDWLTLFIPFLMTALLGKIVHQAKNNKAYWFLAFPLMLVFSPFFILRQAVGAITAVISAPLTIIVHIFSSLAAYNYKKTLENLSNVNGKLNSLSEIQYEKFIGTVHKQNNSFAFILNYNNSTVPIHDEETLIAVHALNIGRFAKTLEIHDYDFQTLALQNRKSTIQVSRIKMQDNTLYFFDKKINFNNGAVIFEDKNSSLTPQLLS